MQPRTLDQILAELQPSYQPSIEFLRQRQAEIPKTVQADIQAAEAARDFHCAICADDQTEAIRANTRILHLACNHEGCVECLRGMYQRYQNAELENEFEGAMLRRPDRHRHRCRPWHRRCHCQSLRRARRKGDRTRRAAGGHRRRRSAPDRPHGSRCRQRIAAITTKLWPRLVLLTWHRSAR